MELTHLSTHIGCIFRQPPGSPSMLVTHCLVEISYSCMGLRKGFVSGGFGLVLLSGLPQMSGQIGKIQKRHSATSEHQTPETPTIVSSIHWSMTLSFVLETYSSFSNCNSSCYFQEMSKGKTSKSMSEKSAFPDSTWAYTFRRKCLQGEALFYQSRSIPDWAGAGRQTESSH